MDGSISEDLFMRVSRNLNQNLATHVRRVLLYRNKSNNQFEENLKFLVAR
jgi:hypothetical protein